MNIPFVDLQSQYMSIKNDIDRVVADVISKSAFIGGSYVQSFEKDFAAYCNVKHCIGVGNGTDALYIALKTLGIGAGDEVITVANSFIATSEAITQTGAKVVFVDINPKTYNIDANKIEEKITPRTKAIVPVHLYGQPADMDPIFRWPEAWTKIVEDCAQRTARCTREGPSVRSAIWRVSAFIRERTLGLWRRGAVVTNDDTLAKKAGCSQPRPSRQVRPRDGRDQQQA
jgi:dTDP-4-amino-4,6-dideoxygalactose transaminase